MQRAQGVEAAAQEVGPRQEIIVILEQEGNAGLQRGIDGDKFAAADAGDQRFRHVQVADLAALRLDIHRAGRIERGERQQQGGFEALLRRLR